ncbi:MAG: shikimate dehydrogenase [bacterium]|nr:shikimate dehydrogenase [bacterium]
MSKDLKLALLGDPIEHSLSPRFQQRALDVTGLHGSYRAIATTADQLTERLETLASEGYAGLNLTVPLKEVALRMLAGSGLVDETAVNLGAVNTLKLEPDGKVWRATNTDVFGCERAVGELAGNLKGGHAVVLGAGGASRAVLLALCRAGVGRIDVWNRSVDRLERMLADLAPLCGETRIAAVKTAADAPVPPCDLLVQTTSLGLHDTDPLPPLPAHGGVRFSLDLITHVTPWQRACAQAGSAVGDGRSMLLWQGVAAFEFWTGIAAPVQAMREVLRSD